MKAATTKPGYHHGDLAEALIAGAEKLLARNGVAELSLRAVAREIGVSQAAPYHHFKSKEELLDALAARGFERLGRQMETAMKAASDPPGQLRANGIAYVSFAVREPELFRLMFGRNYSRPNLPARHRAVADRSFALFAGACEAAFRPDDRTEAMEFQLGAWSLAHGLASLLVDKRVGELARGILAAAPADRLSDARVEQVAARVFDAMLTPIADRGGG